MTPVIKILRNKLNAVIPPPLYQVIKITGKQSKSLPLPLYQVSLFLQCNLAGTSQFIGGHTPGIVKVQCKHSGTSGTLGFQRYSLSTRPCHSNLQFIIIQSCSYSMFPGLPQLFSIAGDKAGDEATVGSHNLIV